MSRPVNRIRRLLVKLGITGGLVLTVKSALADSLTDLVTSLDKPDKPDRQLVNSPSTSLNKIIALRVWPSTTYTRITIETQQSIQAKYFILQAPSRVVVDIKHALLNGVVENSTTQVVSQDPVVSNIKVGQFTADTVRIVIYLKTDIQVQAQILEPINFASISYKYRYLLDIYSTKDSINNTQTDLDDDILARLQLDSESSAVVRPNYATIGTPTKAKLPTRKILVMLDPGHGGEDPGAVGHYLKEKHVVLDIAKRLQELINRTDYMYAKLTRTSDIFIPLATRVAIARKYKADIFISIHADAFTSPQPRGSSVFVLSDRGASSAFSRWLAKTQNQSDQIGGISFKTKSVAVNKMLLDMSQTFTRRQSSKFAALVMNNLAQVHSLHSNQVEQAGFAVLKAPDIPSILVETAFISNPTDESLLKSDAFRDKIANAIFAAVDKYTKTLLT
jgi:N-acetylmuramoyl-L-alanine amidase